MPGIARVVPLHRLRFGRHEVEAGASLGRGISRPHGSDEGCTDAAAASAGTAPGARISSTVISAVAVWVSP